MITQSTRVCLAIALFLAACGGPATGTRHGGDGDGPPAIDASNVHEVHRAYLRMDPADDARIAWRDALMAHYAQGSSAVLERGDYDAVVEHLARLTELMTPADVEANRVPDVVAPVARWVIEHGSPRGDEGRVMGAHLLLAAIGEDRDAHVSEREEIAQWGRSARASISNPIERYGELIQVWEQHEQIAPSPEVLDMLARLYLEQRDALRSSFGPEGQGNLTPGEIDFRQLRLVPLLIQRAPLDVAAVFLRHGDLEGAVAHVERIEPAGEDTQLLTRLTELLEQAQENNRSGAAALAELAQGFSQARPSISSAICRLGVRRFPDEASFPLCLARAAIAAERASEATAWYAEAVRLAPETREVHDEALRQLSELMENGIFDQDIGESRSIATSALSILEQYEERWPTQTPDVTRAQILMHLGLAEMSSGNVAEARQRLRESLAIEESREAHVQLGLLAERLGQGEDAATHYRAALDATPPDGVEGMAGRAELTERLGDAFRRAGRERQAQRMYGQALSQWDTILQSVSGPRSSIGHVRRGILLSHLGEHTQSNEAFAAAIEAAPTWRGPYASILAHLVVSDPNLELAQRVLRRAQFQLQLEPEWKVYFALWVQAIAARASEEPERDVRLLLEELAEGSDWSNRLAAFGGRSLEYPALREHASNRGQRVEADFYQGARLLGAGDSDGARRLFERVIESGMVSFYEYAMAQDLLRAMGGGEDGVAEAPSATP